MHLRSNTRPPRKQSFGAETAERCRIAADASRRQRRECAWARGDRSTQSRPEKVQNKKPFMIEIRDLQEKKGKEGEKI